MSDPNKPHKLTAEKIYLSLLQHDLFSATANIQLCLEDLLENTILTSEQRDLLRSLEYSQKKLTIRGKNLLDFQKLDDKSRIQVIKTAIDIRHMLSDNHLIFENESRPRNIDFSFHCDIETSLLGDFGRIERMIWNINLFFLRFTQTGGAVNIEARQSGDQVTLEWVSSHCSISAPILNQWLSTPAPLTETESEETIDSDQIAMRVVRAIVEQHNGTIELSSEPSFGHLSMHIALSNLLQ